MEFSRLLSMKTIVAVLSMIVFESSGTVAQTVEEPLPTAVVIPQAGGRITIDGRVDEEAWRQAAAFELAFEVDPGENTPAAVRTELFLAYDETNLYIAFRCHDADPSQIRAFYTRRDAIDGDWVSIDFDTYNDERRSLSFAVNPLGVQWDAIRTHRYSADTSWDAVWDSAGVVTDGGYEVEIAIPFSSISFQRTEGEQVWGLDAWRNYPRDIMRRLALVPYDYNNNCYHCQMKKVRGFESVTPGNRIELIPTITGLKSEVRPEMPGGEFFAEKSEVEAGLTARWGVTPNINLALTANPDFSQVEADALQLEINRQFAIYYPEKRPFFTEGSDFFNTCMNALHTRMMVSPQWGLKATGKEGANTFGIYHVKDDLTSIVFPGNEYSRSTVLDSGNTSSVLRYKRDFGQSSNLGFIYTGREGSGYHSRLVGIDGDFRLTSTDAVYVEGYASSTAYPEAVASSFLQPQGSFGDSAVVVEYYHDQRHVSWVSKYWNVGKNFRADLGELPIVGFEYVTGALEYRWYADRDTWWSSVTAGGGCDVFLDNERELLNRAPSFWIRLNGDIQSSLMFHGQVGLKERFMGSYFDKSNYLLSAEFRPFSRLGYECGVYFGDEMDYENARVGSILRAENSAQLELGRSLLINARHIYERLDVEGADLYSVHSADLWLMYHFTRRLYGRAVLQYMDILRNAANYTFSVEPQFRKLFLQLLLSYELNPRTVLYIGYSGNGYGSADYGLTQADRTFFVKLGYALTL